MILHGNTISIPEFGKFPNLVEGENFTMLEDVSLTPFVNPFFRLEEKHCLSGEDQVIVPVGKGERKVDEQIAVCDLSVLDFKIH
jgi:hypothetical protein